MKLRKKRLCLAMVILAVVAVAGIWIWHASPKGPEQIITTPDGAKFRFVGVTYSKENVPPSVPAKLLRGLPMSWANAIRRRLGVPLSQYNVGSKSDEPQFFFWFQRMTTNSSLRTQSRLPQRAFIPSAVLADETGVLAGGQAHPLLHDDVVWSYVSFPLVPRRSRTLKCFFYEGAYREEAQATLGKVTISNPLYGHYPEWQPEPLPALKKSGDLEVRLEEVAFGNPQSGATILRPNGSRTPPLKPTWGGERIQTQFDFSVRSARGTNEAWILQSSVLSDATGNLLAGKSERSWIGTQFGLKPQADWRGMNDNLSGTLWPNEAAWRLKLAFKRSIGFASNELVTFTNVPIPAMGTTSTNPIVVMAGKLKLVLRDFERHADIPGNSLGTYFRHILTELTIEMPGRSPDLAFDVWEVKTDMGEAKQFGHSDRENSYVLSFRSIPTNATKMNLTFVAQKTRSFEFTFKPPKSGRED